MSRNCAAVAKSTRTACQKRAIPGSQYCLFHLDRTPLILGGLIGAILSLIVSEFYRTIFPSVESQQLIEAQKETSNLKRVFTEREQHLSSQMDALVKGNDALQKMLEPFRKVAIRRFPQMETESALAKLAIEVDIQRKELNAIRRYTQVSKLNFIGTTGTAVPPLKEETGISRMLEGTFSLEDNRARFACDPTTVGKLQQVIAQFPDFPFSYYALAFCLNKRGEASWKGYATKAVEILENTTTIDGHHPNHDQALHELKSALRS